MSVAFAATSSALAQNSSPVKKDAAKSSTADDTSHARADDFIELLRKDVRFQKKQIKYVFNSINLRDVITGLIKSVVFATIIAHVGCLEGFRVRGGPDSVGRSTTSAVVKSTFLVIVADAVFTAIFYFTVKS